MLLTTGAHLGPYEIVSLLGSGAMGEVYRAHDTRLNRDVALKILPPLAPNRDRCARFRREAQILASLSHPNIGAIYGFEEAAGMQALVLELVDGPTLADRLVRGRLALEEALPVARQIAQALEAAHEQGISHRDLKPANIKLRPEGTVKVLDFGLAKACVGSGPNPDLSQDTTRTVLETRTPVMLGTPAYMSPEQARGGIVDQRSDVWAFGCVLYQMLTGSRAFPGETVSDVIGAVLERAPDWEALPLHTPTSIRRLLRRCLEKDRKQRLRDIGDALADIDDASNPEDREVSTLSAGRPALLAYLALLATTAVATAMVTGLIVANRTSSTEQRPTRFTVAAPPGAQIAPAPPILSPDGLTLVFVACVKCDTDDLDDWVVYQRRLDQLQAVPI